MWLYRQSTGKLYNDAGNLVATGYAGKPPSGKNNPMMQAVVGVGPLPRGYYSICAPVDNMESTGKYSLPLIPAQSNRMFGRSGFFIHGDLEANPGYASDGCIVMPPDVRLQIWASLDHTLEVTI